MSFFTFITLWYIIGLIATIWMCKADSNRVMISDIPFILVFSFMGVLAMIVVIVELTETYGNPFVSLYEYITGKWNKLMEKYDRKLF